MISIKTILLIGHIVGVALGVGGATMSDVLFLTSISDARLDPSELRLLKIASKVVIMGLALLCVTGAAFFFVGSEPTTRFWAKLTILGVVVVNGAIMHTRLFPIFEKVAERRLSLLSSEFTQHAPLLVSCGVISAVSWYGILLLGLWRSLPLSYGQILGIYVLIVINGVVVSNAAVQFALQHPRQVQQWWLSIAQRGVIED